jgi:hypothetical protein
MTEFVRDVDRNLYNILKTYNISKEDREDLLTLVEDNRPVVIDLMVAAHQTLKMTNNLIDASTSNAIEISTIYMKKSSLYDKSVLHRTILKYCYLIRKIRGFNDF